MHGDHTGWSDSSARAVLQLMAESVAEMVGFEVAALSVIIDDVLVTVAYTGPEELREYVEQNDPASVLDPVLEAAVAWGPRLRFLGDTEIAELDGHWIQVEQVPTDGADAWSSTEVLLAVLSNDDGELVGVLSVDRPVTGRRPDDRQRSLLERYAAQAERAVLTAFEREDLVRHAAHAETARRLIRSAAMPAQASLDAVLHHTHRPLVEGFAASGSWIQVFDAQGIGRGYARAHDGADVELSEDTIRLAEGIARDLWAEQRALVVGAGVESDAPALLDRQLEELGLASLLAVGLGTGSECLGFLVLTRRKQDLPWSSVEIDSALQIGHDLGAAVMTAQALERERALVRELQQLDDYRSQLIATLSHELRTPLTVITGNLELLGGLDLEPLAVRFQKAMERGSERMAKVVEDLLLLAKVSDPQHPLERVPVDLRAIVRDVLSFVDSTAQAKGVRTHVDLGPDELLVPGDPTELDRLVGNLVSNAVKYTPAGGTVTVSAARRDDTVALSVADDGLGISEEDQRGLFRAFFRTTNPDALREPGTGLGLAIVATVAERHDGSVTFSSTLGAGTTFTVTLPVRTPSTPA